MAHCSKCGNEITAGAQFCRSCGTAVAASVQSLPPQAGPAKRKKSVFKRILIIGFLVFFGLIVLGIIVSPPADQRKSGSSTASNSSPAPGPTEANAAVKPVSESSSHSADTPKSVDNDTVQQGLLLYALLGVKNIHDGARNPDSVKLSQVLIMDDHSICYTYRAQNGFGGMNVDQAVLTPDGTMLNSERKGFDSLWNKRCAHKRGSDRTQQVDELYKKTVAK